MTRAAAVFMALVVTAFTAAACHRAAPVAPATASSPRSPPPQSRVPEPVAPTMSPVLMPAAVVSAPLRDRDRVRDLADSVLRAPMWRNARWGMLIVDAASGDTIVAHDGDKLFMPASNQKLLTSAVAMRQLGPDWTWRTPVLLSGRQRGKVWQGDLLMVGTGDPSFSDSLRNGDAASAFDPIVAALAARGIARITGRVLASGDAFTGATTGFGWEIDDLDESYGAPVDELFFNEGEFRFSVQARGKAGTPLVVTRHAASAYPAIRNLTVTRTVGADSAPALRAAYDSIGDAVVITGSLPPGDSASFTMSYRHPADAALAEVRARLVSRGIAIGGNTIGGGATGRTAIDGRVTALSSGNVSSSDAPVDTLVVLQSPPIGTVLRRMQKPSQNQIAELLFRTTGLQVSGVGSADSARAVGARTLAALGVGAADVAYRDGSGLSRHDYVTPRAIVRVLDAMRQAPWFESYRQALPLAAVDGTLRNRMKGTAAAGNAQAKTGTVDKARSLSGYVTTADGRLVIFSLLANNFTVPTREVERVQDLLVVALAGARLGDEVKRVP